MDAWQFEELFSELTHFKKNQFHPLVCITGKPTIGRQVYIGAFSEINAKDASVTIGDYCDIASFVSINCADSHLRCIEQQTHVARKAIVLQHHVFVGSHSVIKGGAIIGHHTVVAAGTVVDGLEIPPFSLVSGNPMRVRAGYYKKKRAEHSDST